MMEETKNGLQMIKNVGGTSQEVSWLVIRLSPMRKLTIIPRRSG